MDIEKMKVAELRTELTNRGLDSKGNKPVLVTRLKEAMEAEEKNPQSENKIQTPMQQDTSENKSDEVVDQEKSQKDDEDEEQQEDEDITEQEEEKKPEEENKEQTANDEPMEEKVEEKTEEKTDDNETKPEDSAQKHSNNEQKGISKRALKRKLNEDEAFVVVEDEPEFPNDKLCLDWFNSDLNMRIDKNNFMAGEPFFKDGWGYVWAGARATYGFKKGKIFYEVKLLDNLEVKIDEESPHEFRIGFSIDSLNFQLGESVNSFAYASSGKKATNSNFEDYGETFAKDDVIGAGLEFNDEEAIITYYKNGTSLGEAFKVPIADLEDEALFPHVLSKNVKFEVNFGASIEGEAKEAFKELPEGFTFAANIDVLSRFRGNEGFKDRKDCEMILLIGLPASGKTTWANKYTSENPEKRYYIIGTNALIEKMKVNGEPKKKHFKGKWDTLIQKCTRCLQDWLRVASQRRRNYIIDQTNVYPNAQKRKIRPFEGMSRVAVVIVPSEEEFKTRVEAQLKAETKDVPDNAVMEMKANFALPQEGEGSQFSKIIFVELQREEASKLVEQYNKDAKSKGFGKRNESKRSRNNFKGNRRGNSRARDRRFMQGGFRGGMRGMPMGRGGGPGGNMRGRGPFGGGGGWGMPNRPNRPQRSFDQKPSQNKGNNRSNNRNFNKNKNKSNANSGGNGPRPKNPSNSWGGNNESRNMNSPWNSYDNQQRGGGGGGWNNSWNQGNGFSGYYGSNMGGGNMEGNYGNWNNPNAGRNPNMFHGMGGGYNPNPNWYFQGNNAPGGGAMNRGQNFGNQGASNQRSFGPPRRGGGGFNR